MEAKNVIYICASRTTSTDSASTYVFIFILHPHFRNSKYLQTAKVDLFFDAKPEEVCTVVDLFFHDLSPIFIPSHCMCVFYWCVCLAEAQLPFSLKGRWL